MRSTVGAAHAPHLSLVSKEERGQAVKRRRLAMGIAGHSEFAEAMENRFDRSTLKRAEEGGASDNTYDLIESWLDRAETENGHAGPAPSMVEVELHDVYGVGQFIARGDPDQVADAVAKILERLREQGDA